MQIVETVCTKHEKEFAQNMKRSNPVCWEAKEKYREFRLQNLNSPETGKS